MEEIRSVTGNLEDGKTRNSKTISNNGFDIE
jgi:hypothetical protein